MKNRFVQLPLLLLASSLALPATAQITVTFKDVENYTDFGHITKDREECQRALSEHINKMAAKLAKGKKLTVEILDVDLAGRHEPTRSTQHEIRYLTPLTWPSMKLHYTLESDGNVTIDKTESINDLNYQSNINIHSTGDSYRHEKYMLDKWFQERIVVR